MTLLHMSLNREFYEIHFRKKRLVQIASFKKEWAYKRSEAVNTMWVTLVILQIY